MKPLVVAFVAAAFLAEPTEDDYDTRVRAAFVEFEASVETIREETETTDPDRLVPVLIQRRSLWVNAAKTGFFERLHNGFWVEKVGNGEAKLFIESGRNDQFIELGFTNGKTRVRLYEDKCDVTHDTKPFQTYYRGKWEQ